MSSVWTNQFVCTDKPWLILHFGSFTVLPHMYGKCTSHKHIALRRFIHLLPCCAPHSIPPQPFLTIQHLSCACCLTGPFVPSRSSNTPSSFGTALVVYTPWHGHLPPFVHSCTCKLSLRRISAYAPAPPYPSPHCPFCPSCPP